MTKKNEGQVEVLKLQLETVLLELDTYHRKFVESERRARDSENLLQEKNRKLHNLSQKKKLVSQRLAEVEKENATLKALMKAVDVGANEDGFKEKKSSRFFSKFKVAKASTNKQVKIIESSTLFDSQWYLQKYRDVLESGVDPAKHFLTYGLIEQRDPGPNFSTEWYLKANPELESTGENPLLHYLKSKP